MAALAIGSQPWPPGNYPQTHRTKVLMQFLVQLTRHVALFGTPFLIHKLQDLLPETQPSDYHSYSACTTTGILIHSKTIK